MTKPLLAILLLLPLSVRAADAQDQFLNLLDTITLVRSGVSLESGTPESHTVPDVGWTPPAIKMKVRAINPIKTLRIS